MRSADSPDSSPATAPAPTQGAGLAAAARRLIRKHRDAQVRRRSDERFSAAAKLAEAIEGFTSEVELSLLYHLALLGDGPGTVVEIGSYLGRSTVVLARALADAGRSHVVAVDPHTSALGFGEQRATDEEFLSNVERSGVAKQVELMKMTSTEAARQWRGDPVRMLFVDGWHSYAAVMEDVRAWAGFLTPDATVVFDDYNHPGIRVAVRHLNTDQVIGGTRLIVGKMIVFAPRSLASKVPHPPGAAMLARLGSLGYNVAYRGKIPDLSLYYDEADRVIPPD